MAVSNAQKLAVKKYRRENIDMITFEARRGKREEYKAAAASMGLGQMDMIRRAIEEFITNHAGEEYVPAPKPEPEITAAEKRLLEGFNKLPDEIQKSVMAMINSINNNVNA